MTEEAKVIGLKHNRNDRLMSLMALITGAAGVLGIVFSFVDWSHASLAMARSHAFPLLLFVFGITALFLIYLIGLWLLTHDRRRIWNTVADVAICLAVGAIAAFIIR